MHSSSSHRGLGLVLTVLCAVLACAVAPALASAASITVDTTLDNPPGAGECEGAAGDCSLRQAIDVANGEPGADTVVLPAGDYGLTIEPAAGTPDDSGDLDVLGELTIEGAGARHSVIDASAIEDRALELGSGGSLDLVGLTVTGGRTSASGGGIYAPSGELSLEGVAVTDNESYGSGSGGGIGLRHGELTILDSTISGNRNSGDGGGVFAEPRKLRIENSTIAGNTVDTTLYPTEPGWSPFGGGIEAFGELLVMKNVTVAGNRIVNANGSDDGSGPAVDAEFDHYEIANTIIAGNVSEGIAETAQCSATFGSLGHDLETAEAAGERRCFEGPTDLVADPLLAALADNGGETDTMAIAAGSPAIDAGDPALCLPTDQRGQARPVGGACDIGAFEYVPPETGPAPPVTASPAPAISPGPGTAAPASFTFGALKRNLRKGTATLAVKFTVAGVATLTGKGVKRVRKQVRPGAVRLAIAPTRGLSASLRRTGRTGVKVTVSFTAAGRTMTKTRRVVLRMAVPGEATRGERT